jgi:hypothetical protein
MKKLSAVLLATSLLALGACTHDPVQNTAEGGVGGAGAGAAIGCLATLPIGCAPGAAVGAAVGGGAGAGAGLASTQLPAHPLEDNQIPTAR